MHGRTVTVNGMSKDYAMTGWRLGYLGAPVPLAARFLRAQQHVITCAASMENLMTAAGLANADVLDVIAAHARADIAAMLLPV